MIRWVVNKEDQSNEAANILLTYFLMQKIKPDTDEETTALVRSIHELLFLIVLIKQNVDLEIVKDFGKEWENFKQMFHPEVECRQLNPPPKGETAAHEHTHEHTGEHAHEH